MGVWGKLRVNSREQANPSDASKLDLTGLGEETDSTNVVPLPPFLFFFLFSFFFSPLSILSLFCSCRMLGSLAQSSNDHGLAGEEEYGRAARAKHKYQLLTKRGGLIILNCFRDQCCLARLLISRLSQRSGLKQPDLD